MNVPNVYIYIYYKHIYIYIYLVSYLVAHEAILLKVLTLQEMTSQNTRNSKKREQKKLNTYTCRWKIVRSQKERKLKKQTEMTLFEVSGLLF